MYASVTICRMSNSLVAFRNNRSVTEGSLELTRAMMALPLQEGARGGSWESLQSGQLIIRLFGRPGKLSRSRREAWVRQKKDVAGHRKEKNFILLHKDTGSLDRAR